MKSEEPADPDNQRHLKKYLTDLEFLLAPFSPPLLFSSPISHCHRIFLFGFISVPMAPNIPPFFCPWSTVQCYSRLWLRTQEGHHLVTRCLFQMPLQGDLATTVVAFGISPVNMCRRCLSPTHTRTHIFWTGDFSSFLFFFFQCCD